MLGELFTLWCVLFGAISLMFLLSIKLKDNSIADLFWGIGFIILATLSYKLYWVWYTAQFVVTLLVFIWWVRLFTQILSKKLPYDGHEDPRYARWRKQWKYFYTRSFFQVFAFQWLLMFIVAIPIFMINIQSWYVENIFLTWLWGLIACIWLLYESRADIELARFMKIKKKWEILTSWLRKFHRYPQYFGESLFWFGVATVALQVSILWFIGWAMIHILVRYVSWVPLLELRYKRNKDYQAYSQITPIFFPDFKNI